MYVSNRKTAAGWYRRVLGFKIVEEYVFWADDPQGPLTIEDQSGSIHLALFARADFIPSTAVAFGSSGEAFLKWKVHLEEQGILGHCSDHTKSWSLYFKDADGNSNEITTYVKTDGCEFL